MSDTARGVWFMLLASFLFTLMTVFVKLLDGIPALEIIFVRAIISVALCLWGLQRAGVPIFGRNRFLLTMRGVTGTIALTLNFYLIHQIPLATASTLTYLAPIFTTLLGIWIVHERVRPWQWLFFMLSFAGVVMIQGYDPRISLFHLGLGVLTSLVMGLAYNCVRKLGGSEHPLVIIFYFPLISLPVAGLWSLFNWVTPTPWQWFYLLMVGISAQMAQYYMTRSYQLAEISTVSILNYTSIVYALVLGYILFDEYFNWMTYAGMALVLAGVIFNVLCKRWIVMHYRRRAAIPTTDKE